MLLAGKELVLKHNFLAVTVGEIAGAVLLGVAAAGLLGALFSKDDDKKKEKSSNNDTRDDCMQR
jgi:hypothetical protein